VKEKTGLKQDQFLTDPQNLNGYSYVRNNPVIYIDPDGHTAWEVATGRQSLGDYQIEIGQSAQQLYDTNSIWRAAMDHPVATGIVVGIGSGLALGAAFPSSVAAIGTEISSSIPMLYNTAVTIGTVGSALLDDTGQSQLPIGTKVGQLGTVIENKSTSLSELGGFTRHGINQIVARGVKPEYIKETLSSPLVTLEQSGGTILYLSKSAVVVLNQAMKVVTAYTSKEFGSDILQLLNRINK
jgi:hypothetical protein